MITAAHGSRLTANCKQPKFSASTQWRLTADQALKYSSRAQAIHEEIEEKHPTATIFFNPVTSMFTVEVPGHRNLDEFRKTPSKDLEVLTIVLDSLKRKT